MSVLLKSPLEKAQGTRDAAAQRLAQFYSEFGLLSKRLVKETDFDAGFALREDMERQERKIAAAKVALAAAEEQLAAEKDKVAIAEGDRAHAELKSRLVPAHEKLIREIAADQRKLAAKLTQAEKLREQIADANNSRGHRAFIADGEIVARGQPGREEPAVYEDQVVWEDGKGNRPFRFRTTQGGEMVPEEVGYTKKIKPVQVRSVRVIEPQCPARFADTVRLVALDGEKLWPR